jgi:hypothetical protein
LRPSGGICLFLWIVAGASGNFKTQPLATLQME